MKTFLVLPLVCLPPASVATQYVDLSSFPLLRWLAVVGLASIVVAITGCLQPEDRIVLDFAENAFGVRIPLIRQFTPAEE